MGERKTIFVGMSSGFGPLAQIIPITEELRKYGFEIICQIERRAGDLLKQMGMTLIDLPAVRESKIWIPHGPAWWNLDYFWGKHGYLDYDYVKELVDVYTETFDTIRPQAVFSAFHPPSIVAARRLGIPVVCVTQACVHPKGKGGRTTWWKDLPPNLERTSDVLNRVLLESGLAPIEKMEDLNVGDLTIIPSIPEFDVIGSEGEHTCLPDVFYTGPMFWQGNTAAAEPEYIISKHRQFLIHAYTGYLFNSGGKPTGIILLDNIVKAFNDTEFEVLISTGIGQVIPPDINAAENITITDWLPVNQVLPQCDLAIHHGGHGSCLQGLAHGVPAIVIATTDEREYNARQVSELGAGYTIIPGEFTPELLLQKAREVVHNPKMKQNTQRIAENIKQRNYNGPYQAAQLVLQLIEKSNINQRFNN